jgi:hypothetical protein
MAAKKIKEKLAGLLNEKKKMKLDSQMWMAECRRTKIPVKWSLQLQQLALDQHIGFC